MSLKVFDLQCSHGHVFEGWFGSADSYESQQAGGLLSCPLCGDEQITRKLSAPRLNIGNIKQPHDVASGGAGASAVAAPATAQLAQLQAQVMRQLREFVRHAEDVGDRFASEALRMGAGEIEQRAIRGTATLEERESLAQEGIVVMPIPDLLDDERLQ